MKTIYGTKTNLKDLMFNARKQNTISKNKSMKIKFSLDLAGW